MSDKAFEIHGYSDKFLSSQKKFTDIQQEFSNFIEGKKLIIHNADFDLAHLNNELSILGKEAIQNEIVDTLNLARNKFPGMSVSLDSLCKKFRIDNSKRTKHTALIDCELLAKVYINLIDQKEPTLDFHNSNDATFNKDNSNVSYFKKVIFPTKDEMLNHKEYLNKNLKKNNFN